MKRTFTGFAFVFLRFQNQMLQDRVIKPLQSLLDCFHGPGRLIQKRQDKHLDYSAATQKKEKNKDPSKSRSVLNLGTTV